MPREISVKIYEFDELSDRAKERAREWWRKGAFDDGLWDDATIEDAKTCLAFAGFAIKEILYTGFSSQGDGACFTGTWMAEDTKDPRKMKSHAPQDTELHAVAAEMFAIKKLCRKAAATITHTGRYYHKYSVDFEFDFPLAAGSDEARARAEALEDQLRERIKEAARRAMQWIYDQLEKEYDYQNSDEQVDYVLRENEYEFTEDGERYVERRAS
jgi:hypothetical protein